MKKIFYISEIGPTSTSVGLWKKIKMQINFFEQNRMKVKFCDVSYNNPSLLHKIVRRIPFTAINKWPKDISEILNYDCIYIRYSYCDFQLIRLLHNVKRLNPNVKVIVEIPTYPYDKETTFSLKMFLVNFKDKWNRHFLKNYVDRILTFSQDEFIFKIPTIQLSNVINFDLITPKIVTKQNNQIINILSVATMTFWHGYDRIIEGLNEYYNRENGRRKIVYHVVGEGKVVEFYKELVKKYNLEGNVIFYGKKVGIELDRIYDLCEIGMDAMGRHRSGIYYNSSLKGKEYGAKGLPIVSGVTTEIDSYTTYPYYMRIPADDSPVPIKKIIAFYDYIYCEDREIIINTVREFNKTKFNINSSWKNVIELINE